MGRQRNLIYTTPQAKVYSCYQSTDEWLNRVQCVGSLWCKYVVNAVYDGGALATLGYDKRNAARRSHSYDCPDNRLNTSKTQLAFKLNHYYREFLVH